MQGKSVSLETLKIVADLSRGLGKFDDLERSCLDDPSRVVSSETGAINVAPDAVCRLALPSGGVLNVSTFNR